MVNTRFGGNCNAVPPRQPMDMPVQDLGQAPASRRIVETYQTWVARLIAFGGAALIVTYGGFEMWNIINGLQANILQWIWWLLFVVIFAWITFSATSAVAGLFFGRVPRRQWTAQGSEARGRTVVVMPVYNEDPAVTNAALEAMAQRLIERGAADGFEIFIISDTRDPAVWVRETAAYHLLREAVGSRIPIWYRRRFDNRGRKAGNLRTFIEEWGGRYRYMIVLDADSLMASDTLVALVDRMEADPELGLLQTLPQLHGGSSLFARLQQFAGFLYGPVVARGVAAWQGRSGNFWGHNAIVRVAAFAQCCGLPELKGKPPFGGSILSHDFVEAALLRRGGWRVCMAPELVGSWEETPPTLLDVAVRDRRWAQGNLQHTKVLSAAGLAWTNRAHFIIGIFSYLASVLWLALITVGLLIAMQALVTSPQYFSQPFQLFPDWPRFDSDRMIGLFLFSLAVLLTPKLIGLLQTLFNHQRRRAVGGGIRVVASAALELFVSALYAPVLMLMQTRQIYEILRGRDAGWNAQRRTRDGDIDWPQIWKHHWSHVIVGVFVSALLGYFSPMLLVWLSPTLIGMVIAPLLSGYSGSERIGRILRAHGLLMIADESDPVALHQDRAAASRRYASQLSQLSPRALLVDQLASARHFSTLMPLPPGERGKPDIHRLSARAKMEEAGSDDEALEWMHTEELMAVLADASLYERLPGSETSQRFLAQNLG